LVASIILLKRLSLRPFLPESLLIFLDIINLF
jgi:hypothetical protein